jgi:hypothetical protein
MVATCPSTRRNAVVTQMPARHGAPVGGQQAIPRCLARKGMRLAQYTHRNGDVRGHIPEQFGTLYQWAYEAGYRQRFRDSYTEVRKNGSGAARS